MLRFGHRRSNSSTQNHPDFSSPPTPQDSKLSPLPFRQRKDSSLSDPLEPLETVWASLECWFDLVKVELEKVHQEQQDQGTTPVQEKVGHT